MINNKFKQLQRYMFTFIKNEQNNKRHEKNYRNFQSLGGIR